MNKILYFLFALLTISLTLPPLPAAARNPQGGRPTAGFQPSKVDFGEQVKYQRAFEAVLWSMPAVEIYGFKRAIEKIGGGPNVIIAWSKPARPNAELVTANNITPYVVAMSDLRSGPVVVEIPAASKKALLYGQIIDQWQGVIADVGPVGTDQGKGGKYLLLPPGYTGEVPDGFFACPSPTFRVYMAFRPIRRPGATAEDLKAYARSMKIYNLNDPEPTRFIDPLNLTFPTLARFDERWFQDLYEIISVENPRPQDAVMTGMLKSLGLSKNQPFTPDRESVQILRQAAGDAWFHLQQQVKLPNHPGRLYWPDRHWQDILTPDKNGSFTFTDDKMIDLDKRAEFYFLATFAPSHLYEKPAALFLYSFVDGKGQPFNAGRNYSLTIPAKVPIRNFWSLIVYDADTMTFIYTKENRQGLSSFDLKKLFKNPDGSVTLYFGPRPPAGKETNWIPTAGKRPFPVLRFYGPEKPFLDKSWKLPDVVPTSDFE